MQELTDLLHEVNKRIAWPAQVLKVIVVLLLKPKGGDRPICLLPELLKLWETVEGDTVASWESERIGFWDDAVEGSSALRAAA